MRTILFDSVLLIQAFVQGAWDGLNVAIRDKSLPVKKIKRLDNRKGANADGAKSEGKDVAM